MIGLSWNIRRLRNPHAFMALSRLLKKHSLDFIFLSETKVFRRKATSIKELFRFGDGFSVDCKGRSGGLMLLWKKDLLVTILYFSVGHIDASIQMDDRFTWRFSGDFNELLCMNEKVGGSEKSILGMIWFRQATDDCDLTDLGCSGPYLTWINKRDGKGNVQERLDRFLANTCLRDKFGQARVEHLGFNSSNHHYILLRLNRVSNSQSSRGNFHAKATIRKKKNFIKKLTDDSGNVQSGEDSLAHVIQEYFSTIFKSSNLSPQDIRKAIDGINSGLSENKRDILNVVFTPNEVRLAIFNLNPTKAPGMDGFHTVVF
ncbi:hypothetical protein EZV62_024775 [Acer yangbiense]|uniref:Endonuclease/exonuclease/phosphatase domain-containing protein n=1 Tax=Acer yangbiense TaxID=1000413 RepID=A0A5C7GW45_9ROSI|nr:hypothetical protein EZV62_024775 [Acer yangbiense]